ncbi:MAG: hypothetical protein ACK5H2_11710 [Beutenbergiaceae bacterium]
MTVDPATRPRRRFRLVLGWLLIVTSALGLMRLAWVALAPPIGQQQLPAELAFLNRALSEGAGADMQVLFPEGEFFMHVLTGLAAAQTDPSLARDQLDAALAPDIAERFGEGMSIDYGIFYRGWSLMLAVEIAQATGDGSDISVVADLAPDVSQALVDSPTGVPASYPGGYWPCDAVVAATAVAQAAQVLERPALIADMKTWRSVVTGLADEELGLLPHRVGADGTAVDGPRGASQSLIQAFWPRLTTVLDGTPDLQSWLAFRDAFVVNVAGLVGVREHPIGVDGVGDVDSGPLIAGVSLSASAVTLAAARAYGDTALAADLDREAELLGLPFQLAGERRYAAGVMPIGDAFLAWARSVPSSDNADISEQGPRIAWLLLALPGLLLLTIGLVLRKPGRARRRRGCG